MEFLRTLMGAQGSRVSRVEARGAYGIGAIMAGLVLAVASAHAAESASVENVVKAAYLSKFGFYVEWPKTAFPSPTSALHLCIAGEDPFGDLLDKAVAAQQGGRPIAILRLKAVSRDSGCHILYVSASARSRAARDIAAVQGGGVLSVSDDRASGDVGAVIHFVIKDNRVRFEIDEEAALRNGLAVSSKLLGLAVNIKRKTPGGTR